MLTIFTIKTLYKNREPLRVRVCLASTVSK
uniref:Uncharacterized protein n=1 Tax=Anguilla anguilla TaxID=7936 RepID=A0A0E9Q481_ANGAN